MKKKYDVEKLVKNISNAVSQDETALEFPSRFFDAYFQGDRTLYQSQQTESKKFDLMWIKTIESYFPSINRITINLKSTLKYQSEIIPIEKTKKVSSESVRHLMMHSNLIREVNEDGVIPKQILTNLSEVEYGIYENRFIMTLILRLRDFIGKRIKVMKESLKGQKVTHLNATSKFSLENNDIEMLVDVKQTESINSRKTDEHNETVLERAEKLYKLINRLNNSQFMTIMKKFKPVNPPILKTQIILKNPDFKNAYLLWLFLDKCNDLGYDLSVETVKKRFTDEYAKNINQNMLMLYSAMLANDNAIKDRDLNGQIKYKETKARQITRLPDEIITTIETPKSIEMEDQNLNEFYLNKSKQILKKQLEQNAGDSDKNYTVSLKKALSETLGITDALYESYFEINADEDIFQRLVKEDDPETMLKEAYEKYNISKTIREVKEQDYLKSIKLEKKWQKQMETQCKLITKEFKADSKKSVENVLRENKIVYDKEKESLKSDLAQEKVNLVKEMKKELANYEKELRANLRKEKSKIATDTKEKIAKEKKKQKLKAQRQKQLELERSQKQKQKMLEKQKLEKEKLKAKALKEKEVFELSQKKKIAEETKKKTNLKKQNSITKVSTKTQKTARIRTDAPKIETVVMEKDNMINKALSNSVPEALSEAVTSILSEKYNLSNQDNLDISEVAATTDKD